MGPNAKKLLAHFIALHAVPSGSGIDAALAFLTNEERRLGAAQAAVEHTQAAIDVVKTAPDNPYGDDDEAIAGAILKRIDELKGTDA